jgi:predicted ATPase/class 3 adenylate cyclase
MPVQDPLGSFLPQALRDRLATCPAQGAFTESCDAAVLAADVSGFTELVAALGDRPGGIEELNAILNDGFGRLIRAITSRGGDVLGFAGDALVAAWPGITAESATEAVSAALEGQHELTMADDRVNVRIGVAGGVLRTWLVGGEHEHWLFTSTGDAIIEATALQARAPLGRVVVSGSIERLLGDALDGDKIDGVEGAQVRGLSTATARRAEAGPADGDEAGSLSISERGAALRNYLPETVVARLGAGHDAFLAELRTLRAVMVRVIGLERLSDLDQFNAVVRTVQRHAFRNEGAVAVGVDEKGVTFFVSFGVPPYAHEDDADRALVTAEAISRALTDGAEFGAFTHGIGVTTGRAFCGAIGSDERRDYSQLGDAVNLAARLAAVACDEDRPSVLADRGTAHAVADRWEFGTPFSVRVKGKSELLTVLSPQRRVGAIAAGHRRSTDDGAVGRVAELDTIESVLVASPADEAALLVIVEGDAGAGKSTLLRQLVARLQSHGVGVVAGYADSLERSTPFHSWTAVFTRLLASGDGYLDRDEIVARVGPYAALLAPVLGQAIEETPETRALSAERRIGATRALLTEVLRSAAAEHGRLVVLLEDAHWFDSASWGVLVDALSIPGLGVVVTMRTRAGSSGDDTAGPDAPDMERVLARSDTHRAVLAPLAPNEVEELACRRLGTKALDPALLDLLVDTCRGNPFFTVEFLELLRRDDALTIDPATARLRGQLVIHVPESIHAAITARVDRFTVDEQLTLKVASVIGTQFSADTLCEVHPTGRDRALLQRDIDVLVDHGLLVAADRTCAFNHALTREVAYRLMTTDQRRDLHRAVASQYESQEMAERQYAVLAHHWLQADDREKAVQYLNLASGSSMAHGMTLESVEHGVKAAGLLGIDLETDPVKLAAMLPDELAEVGQLMEGRQPADLIALPELIDEERGLGIAIVLQTMPAAHQSLQSELFALMAVRNLATTLRFGAGLFAPGVYAMYSIVLRGMGLDGRSAYEFSELARSVDASTGGHLAAAVDFISAWFNYHWYNPVIDALPIALEGANAGLAGADPLYGSFNLGAAITITAVSGATLNDVIAMSEKNLERIAGQSATAAFHNQLEAQVAKALSGRTAGLASLSDESLDESALAAICDTQNYNQVAYYFIAKLFLAYLASDPAALDYARSAEQLLPSFVGQFRQAEFTTLGALARLAHALELMDRSAAARDALLTEVQAAIQALAAWSDDCPSNFAHQYELVRGETAALDDDLDGACVSFERAVECAEAGGFIQWAALAYERWARALRRSDQDASSQLHAAAGLYARWGAAVKAAEMELMASS